MDMRMRGRISAMEQILAATGQPGVSVGVIHNSQVVFRHNIGYRDVRHRLKADCDTLYCIASLTKAFITASLAILADENKVRWTEKVSDLIPTLRTSSNPTLEDELTLTDLISHRSGLISLDQLIQGLDGRILVPKKDAVSLMNELPVRSDLRTEFWYTNVPFSVAGQIIEDRGSCTRWDEFVHNKILSPLQMLRTTADPVDFAGDSNVAEPYTTLPDGQLAHLNQPEVSSATLHGCSGGIRSSINDMLRWAQALLSESKSISNPRQPQISSLQLHQKLDVSRVFESATIIDPKSTVGGEYCLGWVRQTTPATLGMISPNRRFSSPVLGKNSASKLVYSHNGDVKGYMASICLFPEEQAAIIALTNGTGMGDCTDWITQDLAQEMFSFEPVIDYVALAREAALSCKSWYHDKFVVPLHEHQIKGTEEPPLEDFIGEYVRSPGSTILKLRVVGSPQDGLMIVINGHINQAYHLRHYHYDTWSMLPTSNEDAIKRGYFGIFGKWEEYLVNFDRKADGTIGWLSWKMDGVLVRFGRIE